MATISNTPRPGYVWDSTDNVWYPIGTGPHTHADYITSGSAINPNIVDAKGDIIAATAADTVARLAVGANDTVLTADSSTATGLKWATPSAGGMTLLSTTSLTGNSVTISSISGSYKHLYILGRTISMTANDNLNLRLNSDSGSNYSMGRLRLTGTTIVGFSATQTNIEIAEIDTSTSWDQRGYFYITIPRYTESELKSYWCESVGRSPSALKTDWRHGVYNSTSAISSVTLYCEAGGTNFSTGTVYVYGVS